MRNLTSLSGRANVWQSRLLARLDLKRVQPVVRTAVCLVGIALEAFLRPIAGFGAASNNCDESICSIWLEGRVGSEDIVPFNQALSTAGARGSLHLYLDSEGGDIYAAMEIGRIVRRWPDSIVIVSPRSKCFSACAFVLAGGLRRIVHGKVGIHRPFGASTKSSTYESTQNDFRALERSAKKFLTEVNVPPSLFDEMMSVPPQQLRILTNDELARYRIGQNDPVYQEMMDADAARTLGFDKEEYLRRKDRADRICNTLKFNEQKAGIEITSSEISEILIACEAAVLRARREFQRQ